MNDGKEELDPLLAGSRQRHGDRPRTKYRREAASSHIAQLRDGRGAPPTDAGSVGVAPALDLEEKGRGSVDQCTAYACPVHPYAAAAPTRSPPTNPPLSGRTRRATLPWHAPRGVDKAPRKTPEKLASPTSPGARNRWSGACTPARGARLTSGRGGGGQVQICDRRVRISAKLLVGRSCICSCIRTRLLGADGDGDHVPRNPGTLRGKCRTRPPLPRSPARLGKDLADPLRS